MGRKPKKIFILFSIIQVESCNIYQELSCLIISIDFFMMENLMNNFNELGKELPPFDKFTKYDKGTMFHVIKFMSCSTKFGPAAIAQVQVDDKVVNMNLPRRFLPLFENEEKLNQWNSKNNLKIIYNGLKDKAILLEIVE